MNGLTDLEQLLRSLAPRRLSGEWVFCSLTPDRLAETHDPRHRGARYVSRKEGLSILLPVERATELELSFDGNFTGITLDVHSSLHAVGLTAVVASRLGEAGLARMSLRPHSTTTFSCQQRRRRKR